jgi:hypothetical protein
MIEKKKYKVRCIDNKPHHSWQTIQNLTPGKIYETTDSPHRDICITNDLNEYVNYSILRFEIVTLQEWRDEKLNEIGIV